MSITTSNAFNSSMTQHNTYLAMDAYQKNEVFQSLTLNSEFNSIIDYSIKGNRLYEGLDGSIKLSETPVGYIIGEQVSPLIDSVTSIAKNTFNLAWKGLSNLYYLQIFPTAMACDLNEHGDPVIERKSWFELNPNLIPPDYIIKKFQEICDERNVDVPKISVYEVKCSYELSDLSTTQKLYSITIETSQTENFKSFTIFEITETNGEISNIQEYHSK